MKLIRFILSNVLLIAFFCAVIYTYYYWDNLTGEDTPAGRAVSYLSEEFEDISEFVDGIKQKQSSGSITADDEADNEADDVAGVDSTALSSSDNSDLSSDSISDQSSNLSSDSMSDQSGYAANNQHGGQTSSESTQSATKSNESAYLMQN